MKVNDLDILLMLSLTCLKLIFNVLMKIKYKIYSRDRRSQPWLNNISKFFSGKKNAVAYTQPRRFSLGTWEAFILLSREPFVKLYFAGDKLRLDCAAKCYNCDYISWVISVKSRIRFRVAELLAALIKNGGQHERLNLEKLWLITFL